MAVGSVKGHMVSTEELLEMRGSHVSVDHQEYTVDRVTVERHNDVAVVDLINEYGPDWAVQVDMEDFAEPMWEMV